MNIKSPQQLLLERYERVNKCETLEELQQCILDFADENGEIQGRSRKFNANSMKINAEGFYNGHLSPNVITREWGLRQQLMYIKYYNDN